MKPLTFNAANEWLASRVNVPTGMSSAELALAPDFPAAVRSHAFFSARVTSANVLDALREEVDRFTAGKTDIATARLRLKTFCSRQGIAPDDIGDTQTPPPGMDEREWKQRKSIKNVASTRRIDLILRQNSGMAHSLGNREVSMHPVVKQRWPFFRYLRGVSRVDHARYHNLVLPKDDPFWYTHTGPWDYGCQCGVEDADAQEATRYGGVSKAIVAENPDGSQTATVHSAQGGTLNIPPSPSGFVWRIDSAFTEPNWAAIPDGPLKAIVRRDYALYPLAKKAVRRHQRRIARKLPAQAPDAETKLAEIEEQIVKNKFETGFVVDETGNVVLRKKGQKYSVSFTPAEIATFADNRFTHNHPRGWNHPQTDPRHKGNSFSTADVLTCTRANTSEIRAVSPGWLHIMRRPKAGWPALATTQSEIRAAESAVQSRFWSQIRAGKVTPEQANAEHYHELWTEFSSKLNIQYIRKRRSSRGK